MKFHSKTILSPLILLPFFSLPLTGCTGYHAKNPDVDRHIDALVERHRYDKAIDIIEEIPPGHEKYDEMAQRIPLIEEKRESIISESLTEARARETDRDWAGAVAVIDNALKMLPNEPVLTEMRNRFEALRQESIDQSNLNILLARGRYLADIRASEENLLLANPESLISRWRYRYYQRKIKHLSQTLHAIGRDAAEENDTETALEALTLSQRLHPDEKSQSLLAEIHRSHRMKRAMVRNNQKAAKHENQWPELEASFNRSMRADDLISARQLVLEMSNVDPEKAEDGRERLEKRIDRKTEVLQVRGRFLYEQGYIKEALDVWQEALRLKPDKPELMQNIHRAETFLENLDRWKQ